MAKSIVRWSDPTAPRARLVCIAHAGAGAARFRAWADAVPDDVALWGVRLAGRESRMRESPVADLDAVMAELLEDLADVPAESLALFGHCSGAHLALVLAHALAARGTAPAHLFIAGQIAPGTGDELAASAGAFDLRELVEQQMGAGTLDDDLAALLVAAIEADVALLTHVEARIDDTRLDVPITAFVGTEDPLPRERVAAWEQRTSAAFTLVELPGGHLLDESWGQLAEQVGGRLAISRRREIDQADSEQIVHLLIATWADVLDTEATPDSDFFDLGGTSLAAIAIADAVAERYADCEGVGAHALQAVFASTSLRGMADELAAFVHTQRAAAA